MPNVHTKFEKMSKLYISNGQRCTACSSSHHTPRATLRPVIFRDSKNVKCFIAFQLAVAMTLKSAKRQLHLSIRVRSCYSQNNAIVVVRLRVLTRARLANLKAFQVLDAHAQSMRAMKT